ncbi:helix-turn-helix domain-containing protein [Sphaerimonospora sp. CA-214678]|uniref:helix-turn-helix domain-containing protein n=1 Tax=Sphaerimonospora sp. CA-214678 TaxID=3240029 RepID=UPI003D90ABA3
MARAKTTRTLYAAGDLDYAVPPGETLRELLEEKGMTQRELAERAGLSPKHVNQLIHGLVRLTPEVAESLERVVGTPAKLWNRLEADYQSTRIRLRAARDLEQHIEWLKELPVSELVKRKILPEEPKDKVARVEQLLAFFAVASVDVWQELYAQPAACAFRKSKVQDSKLGPLATWLRIGEIEAQRVPCRAFDATALRKTIPELRALTLLPVAEFRPRLQEICSSSGVAVVFVEEVRGARVSGVTRKIGTKRVIQLSHRYRTDDQLWFSFFHELHHVLNGDDEIRIEIAGKTETGDPKELEADRFAADTLIPPYHAHRLAELASKDAIRSFAHEIGIAPGIVVGRLQRDFPRRWPYRNGNDLKRKLELIDS